MTRDFGRPLPTFSSFVNTWECDDNAHMNVQFYFRAFQQASEVFALQCGQVNPGGRSAIVRHVRYHRELRAARPYTIHSAVLAEGPAAGSVVHFLRDSERDTLSATALDQPGYRIAGAPMIGAAEAALALPRGLEPGPSIPGETAGLVRSAKAIVVHRSVLRPAESGTDGDLAAEAIISRFTDGVPHVWGTIGITSDWLSQTGHGRVAVEMKVTRLARAEAGSPLALITWIPRMEAKTFIIRHQIENFVTGAAIASGEVRCLVMNLSSRRAVPMPDFALEAFAAANA
jgi:acyl-CoA thioester hydrolase